MCILLGVFHEFPVDPYYEPLAWFMIASYLKMHAYSGEAQELINQWHTIQVRSGGKVVRRSAIFLNACDESVTVLQP